MPRKTKPTTTAKPKPTKKTLAKKTPPKAEPSEAEMLAQVEAAEEAIRRVKDVIANLAKAVQAIQSALADDPPDNGKMGKSTQRG